MKLSALLDANYRIQVKKCVENMFLTSPHERKRKGYVGGGGGGGKMAEEENALQGVTS